MAPKSVAPSVAMESGGASESWEKTLSNQQNIGNMFLAYIEEASPELGAKWGAKWSEVTEEHACAQELFAHLATFLVNVYVSPLTSRKLEMSSVLALWQGLLQQNKKRFNTSTVQTTKVRACRRRPPLQRCAHA